MQPSIFNVRVPLRDQSDVFLMNTLTDAQIIVPPEVVSLLDSVEGRTRAGVAASPFDAEEREALATLTELGFVVESHQADRRALDAYFDAIRHDTSQLRLTVLTTLQCNFACGYCFQGDHDDHNRHAHKMSLETAHAVVEHAARQMDEIRPERVSLTFFGGEPLLNLPVVYHLAEHVHTAATARGIRLTLSIITNGLLLTPEVVDRLVPYGLTGVKVTLDGDKAAHDLKRPLRGGQGTFDKIVANVRAVAHKVAISIGGNFDADNADSYPALLDFLAEEEFAPKIAKVSFKPVMGGAAPSTPGAALQAAKPSGINGIIPLTAVAANGAPLGGTCMTVAGAGGTSKGTSACDTCHFVDETMGFLREETKKRGFPTIDGVHMGPCEIHRQHAETIGPDGALYACPGFTGEASFATGHIAAARTPLQAKAADRFDRIGAWRNCGDCSFIPVCAGGCSVASHTELGDLDMPACHRPSLESALVSLAADAAALS
ncbi:MAG: radical SAM protein [Vicinamibacteraceae bacterium]